MKGCQVYLHEYFQQIVYSVHRRVVVIQHVSTLSTIFPCTWTKTFVYKQLNPTIFPTFGINVYQLDFVINVAQILPQLILKNKQLMYDKLIYIYLFNQCLLSLKYVRYIHTQLQVLWLCWCVSVRSTELLWELPNVCSGTNKKTKEDHTYNWNTKISGVFQSLFKCGFCGQRTQDQWSELCVFI